MLEISGLDPKCQWAGDVGVLAEAFSINTNAMASIYVMNNGEAGEAREYSQTEAVGRSSEESLLKCATWILTPNKPKLMRGCTSPVPEKTEVPGEFILTSKAPEQKCRVKANKSNVVCRRPLRLAGERKRQPCGCSGFCSKAGRGSLNKPESSWTEEYILTITCASCVHFSQLH